MDWVEICLLALQTLVQLLLFFLGASLFSFVNVIAYRVPRGVSVVHGRSHCPQCGAVLRARDETPLLGWLLLRGKCRDCHAPIAIRYFLMECAGGGLALLCTALYGTPAYGVYAPTAQAALVFAVCAVWVAIALCDFELRVIPNRFLAALGVCGVAACFLFPAIGVSARLLGILCASAPMLLLTLLVPGGFGGGDIKLMAVAGFFLGWKLCAAAFALAILTGGCYSAVLLISRGKNHPKTIAFAPFLCACCGLVLFGANIKFGI